MKKIFLTILWMFLFWQVGIVIFVIATAFLPLPSSGDVGLRLVIVGLMIFAISGPPLLALFLCLKGLLPGTKKNKTETAVPVPFPFPGALPPPISRRTPPPLPGKKPRELHHAFTHEYIPLNFIHAKNRAQYIAHLLKKEFKETIKQSWRHMAREHGEDPNQADLMDYAAFRNDPYFCGWFEFPPAKYAGEAISGLLVAGPLADFASIDWNSVPIRYFILERDSGPSTRLLEWTPKGYQLLGPGPRPQSPVTVFADMVFDRVFAKKPPMAQQVATRLLILQRIGTYAQAVPYGQKLNSLPDVNPGAKADLHSIFGGSFSSKLQADNLWDDVSPKERELLQLHVKDITQQQLANELWRLESVQVLMWALGLLPRLPRYDSKANGEILGQMPPVTPAEFIASAKLRDEKEIEQARRLAELWHWRSRTRQLQEEGRPCPVTNALKSAGLDSYEAIIRMTVQIAGKDGRLDKSLGDDFPVFEKPYREMTFEEWAEVRSITMERHFALNWLCGLAPANKWDNTPTET